MRGLTGKSSDERGAVLVIVAIMLIAIFGFVVIVVDVGGLLTLRREMVRTSDSAALAAAQSFALNSGDASAQADSFAGQNVDSPVRTSFTTTAGIPGFGCVPTSCGSVTVRYTKNQPLYFAPVLGLSSVEDVAHTSKAIWGPPGSGIAVVPLTAAKDAFKPGGDCEVPNTSPGTECPMWYSSDATGTSTMGWTNLNTNAWNVASGAHCNNSGADSKFWLDNPVTDLAPLNWPAATYVCADTGVVDTDWERLRDMAAAHVTVSFPVNDNDGSYSASHGGTGPHGQINGGPSGVDKWDVIGFVNMRLIALYDGNDPAVVGTPGTPAVPAAGGSCQGARNFDPGDVVSVSSIAGTGCPGGIAPDAVTPGTPFVYVKTPYVGCAAPGAGCDYTYNALTFQITWVGKKQNGVQVDFGWSRLGQPEIPAVPGACGIQINPKKQDKCLVAEWTDFVVTGADPGAGADFGIRAIRLAQ
jgi:hypothetical protein